MSYFSTVSLWSWMNEMIPSNHIRVPLISGPPRRLSGLIDNGAKSLSATLQTPVCGRAQPRSLASRSFIPASEADHLPRLCPAVTQPRWLIDRHEVRHGSMRSNTMATAFASRSLVCPPPRSPAPVSRHRLVHRLLAAEIETIKSLSLALGPATTGSRPSAFASSRWPPPGRASRRLDG